MSVDLSFFYVYPDILFTPLSLLHPSRCRILLPPCRTIPFFLLELRIPSKVTSPSVVLPTLFFLIHSGYAASYYLFTRELAPNPFILSFNLHSSFSLYIYQCTRFSSHTYHLLSISCFALSIKYVWIFL